MKHSLPCIVLLTLAMWPAHQCIAQAPEQRGTQGKDWDRYSFHLRRGRGAHVDGYVGSRKNRAALLCSASQVACMDQLGCVPWWS